MTVLASATPESSLLELSDCGRDARRDAEEAPADEWSHGWRERGGGAAGAQPGWRSDERPSTTALRAFAQDDRGVTSSVSPEETS